MITTYYKNGIDAHSAYLDAITENEYGDIVDKHRVYCPLLQINHNDKLFLLQYDDNMNLLYDVCNYLNFYLEKSSDKTRLFKAWVMRQFVCFMKLIGFDRSTLTDPYVFERICRFFANDDYRSEDNSNYRSSYTINNYLSVIRDYALFLELSNNGLNEMTFEQLRVKIKAKCSVPKAYVSSLRNNPHAKDLNRPYISPIEFTTLRQLAINQNDVQALILFHLMYFYGLRIGECLGLTEEDFEIRHNNYSPSPTLFLRNRLSDKPFQYAKGLGHILSTKKYAARSYPSVKVRLSASFYTKITEYIQSVRQNCEKKGTYDKSIADTIFLTKRGQNSNHYIFRNIYGKPLSQQAWNLRLKDYFSAAMIPIDTSVREDNLNHRFRHGCALYYLRFADEGHKMSLEQVSALLRHKRLESTAIYLKMTIDDEFEIKSAFQDALLHEIPALNE